MTKTGETYNRILDYLRGLLTGRQQHQLEKEMMRDSFDEEAFEGLSSLSASGLETDMDLLMHRLDKRTASTGRQRSLIFKIAAALLIFAGIGTTLTLVLHKNSQHAVNETIIAETKVAPEEKAPLNNDMQPMTEVTSTPEKKSREPLREERPHSESLIEEDEKIMVENDIEQAPAMAKALMGRVVDIDGQAMPGIAVQEVGTINGTVTGADGQYYFQIADTAANKVEVYPDYKTLALRKKELPTSQPARTIEENVGAISTVVSDKIAGTGSADMIKFTDPVPPGGSLRVFKNMVDTQLDHALFRQLTGRHRIQVTLTIGATGLVKEVAVNDTVAAPFASELKRVITKNQSWQPAKSNGEPVESTMMILFVIDVE
jgi:hypothetical protein